MHIGYHFGTNVSNIVVMHRLIMNHFAMMIHILFGSGALLVLLLVILIHVLKINKVMCLIRRHMKLWYAIY